MSPIQNFLRVVIYPISIVINTLCIIFIGLASLFTLAGIAGFVWLLFLGEWGVAGLALLGCWAGAIPLGLSMLPGRMLFPPVVQLVIASAGLNGWLPFPPANEGELRERVDNSIQFFIRAQTLIICAAWCGLIFHFLPSLAKPNALIPALLVAQMVSVRAFTMAIEAREANAVTLVFSGACRMGFFLAATATISLQLTFPGSFIVFFIAIPLAFQLLWSGWTVFGFDKIWLEHHAELALKQAGQPHSAET